MDMLHEALSQDGQACMASPEMSPEMAGIMDSLPKAPFAMRNLILPSLKIDHDGNP